MTRFRENKCRLLATWEDPASKKNETYRLVCVDLQNNPPSKCHHYLLERREFDILGQERWMPASDWMAGGSELKVDLLTALVEKLLLAQKDPF